MEEHWDAEEHGDDGLNEGDDSDVKVQLGLLLFLC